MRTWSRRSFLGMAGGGLGLAVLSACGGSSNAGKEFDLGKRFSDDSLVPGDVRMPVSLVVDGQLANDGPGRLTGRITDDKGTTVVDKVTADKHGKGLPGAYWPFTASIASPGIYTLFVDGATKDGMAFQVNDPSKVQIPLVGQPLPPFDTPTNAARWPPAESPAMTIRRVGNPHRFPSARRKRMAAFKSCACAGKRASVESR